MLFRSLFWCKSDRAEHLAEQGWLVLPGKRMASPRESGNGVAWVAGLPFATAIRGHWQAGAMLSGGAEARAALDDYAAALDTQAAPAARLAALEQAFSQQAAALDALKTPVRLATAARLSRALGARTQARMFVEDALARLEGGLEDSAGIEPFLPATAAFDNRVADSPAWMLCMLRSAYEELRHFSSYFTHNESHAALKKLTQAGCLTAEMERRRQLIRLRYGLQEKPEWTAALADSRNQDFWKQRAPP